VPVFILGVSEEAIVIDLHLSGIAVPVLCSVSLTGFPAVQGSP
jgi:hypothetical protein